MDSETRSMGDKFFQSLLKKVAKLKPDDITNECKIALEIRTVLHIEDEIAKLKKPLTLSGTPERVTWEIDQRREELKRLRSNRIHFLITACEDAVDIIANALATHLAQKRSRS